MSAAELMTDLARLGIRVAVHGDRLRYSPRSAVTPELTDRMKAHKDELLAMLRSAAADLGTCEDCGQKLIETLTFDGFLNLECPGCDRCFGCRPSTDEIAARFAGGPENPIPVSDDGFQVVGEVVSCSKCGSLELWESVAGDMFGRTPGKWRCLHCDPPTAARGLRDLAAQIRSSSTNKTIHDQDDRLA